MGKKEKSLNEHRQAALAELYKDLDKQFGPGTARPIPERNTEPVERISTGLISMDYVTGGGIPRGRITVMHGPESGGKTTLALSILAQMQRGGGTAAFIDAEHSFDPEWATLLGVDISKMLYHAPDSGEQALSVAEVMILSGSVDVIVVDSVAALVPETELAGDIGEAHVGLMPRLMSQSMRKLVGPISREGCAVVFINQIREKIGVMYGPSETTPGGHALKHTAAIILDVRRGESIGNPPIGIQVKVRAVKNKTAPPFRKGKAPLLFSQGFDTTGELVDLASEAGLIRKSGAWYYFGDERMGQGRESAVQWLRSREDVQEVLRPQLGAFLETGGS